MKTLNKFKTLFKKKVSFLSKGENVVILEDNKFSLPEKISIGNNVYIGTNNNFLSEGITIGDGTIIASYNEFRTVDHY